MSDNLNKNDKNVAKKQAIIPSHWVKWMFWIPEFSIVKTINKDRKGITYFAFINGVLKELEFDFLFRWFITNTPAQTIVKANNVPILHKSVTILRFINNEGIATTKPTTIVAKLGVR